MISIRNSLLAMLLLAGAANADIAPDYPLTRNQYRVELQQGPMDQDLIGAKLVLVSHKQRRGEEQNPPQLSLRPIGSKAFQVDTGHWSRTVKHELCLIKGELPKELTTEWLSKANVLGRIDMTRLLSGRSRAKDDNAAFRTQEFTIVISQSKASSSLEFKAKTTHVKQLDAEGNVLEESDLSGKETGYSLPDSTLSPLKYSALIGFVGLFAMILTRGNRRPA